MTGSMINYWEWDYVAFTTDGDTNPVGLLYKCIFGRQGQITECVRQDNEVYVRIEMDAVDDFGKLAYRFCLAPGNVTFREVNKFDYPEH